MSRWPTDYDEIGDPLACPECGSACRSGSMYHRQHGGRCHRCRVVMTVSAFSMVEREARVVATEPPKRVKRRT